ncbi:GNAT family protein [Microbacterium deminutum]|uniref:GNAT family N-acetyltransferase n=1 Tax=Microbacterium deminutum TaxID=344164 RepID=A0ABP5BI43_9MICO
MAPVTLRTDRTVLSIPTEADLDAITEAAQDPEVPRWTTLPSPYARADAEQFVGKVAEWWDAETDLVWGIRVDGRWVGALGLHRVQRGGSAEIGYWMALPARGKGYLTEAARAAIDFAFDPGGLDLKRLEWRAVVGNVPSARAAHALGFRYEGLVRQGLSGPRGRDDGWIAGLLSTDDRMPQPWPVVDD